MTSPLLYARLAAQLAADDLHAAPGMPWRRRALRVAFVVGIAIIVAVALDASAAEPARPTEPLYHVELIILKPTTPLGVAEDWAIEAQRAQPATTTESEDEEAAAEPVPQERLAVRTLAPAQFKLGSIESALGRSGGYEMLKHVGWTQAATPRGAGPSVELADVSGDAPPVRGTVTLERGKYLYLRLNLAYAPDVPPNSLLGATPDMGGPVTFALKQARRIRPFERHYFDHPAFGVIAMVSTVGGSPR
jgi:hypothetical protein